MIILGIEIMHVWEAQSWEQSNVIWVLKLWEVTHICRFGRYHVNEDVSFFVLFNHKKNISLSLKSA